MIHLLFDLDIDDLLAFQDYYNENSTEFKRMQLIIRFLLPVICLLIFLFFCYKDGIQTALIIGALYLPISIWWIIYMPKLVRKNSLKRNRKALEKQQKTDPSFGYRDMFFDDDGIRIKNKGIDTSIKWSRVVRIVQKEDYFYLFLSDREAFIVPIKKIGLSEKEALMQLFTEKQ